MLRPLGHVGLRIRRDADVGGDAVELAIVGREPLDGRDDRHELADLAIDRLLERGVMGGFGGRDLVDRHVGDRHEPTGNAADRIVVAVLLGDELAAVAAMAESMRQELGGDQFVDGVGG